MKINQNISGEYHCFENQRILLGYIELLDIKQ